MPRLQLISCFIVQFAVRLSEYLLKKVYNYSLATALEIDNYEGEVHI